MTQMTASPSAGAVLRYGNPVFDCDGAWIRALSRQLATVVTVGGSVGTENIDRVTAFVNRFIPGEKPFVLDLSAVDAMSGQAARLLDAVADACENAGVEWAMVAGEAVVGAVGDAARGIAEVAWPVVASVPDALEHFAEANQRRRSMVLPLLAAKLTRSA